MFSQIAQNRAPSFFHATLQEFRNSLEAMECSRQKKKSEISKRGCAYHSRAAHIKSHQPSASGACPQPQVRDLHFVLCNYGTFPVPDS